MLLSLLVKETICEDLQELEGRALRVNYGPPPPREEDSFPRGGRGGGRFGGGGGGGGVDSGNRVYVGNLPWSVDNLALENLFSEQGKVLEAKVVYDRDSGRSRGFGFVTYDSADEVSNAIESLNGAVSIYPTMFWFCGIFGSLQFWIIPKIMLYFAGLGWKTNSSHSCGIEAKAFILNLNPLYVPGCRRLMMVFSLLTCFKTINHLFPSNPFSFYTSVSVCANVIEFVYVFVCVCVYP